MNCDEFLPALETGGPLQRRRARQHAATCAKCAAFAARFAAMKREWAETPPPLSARERQIWQSAAMMREAAPPPPVERRIVLWPWAAGLAACILLAVGVVAVVLIGRDRLDQVVERPVGPTTNELAGAVRVGAADPAAEMAELSAAVEELEAEMRELRSKAERAEARRQVALVLERFERS